MQNQTSYSLMRGKTNLRDKLADAAIIGEGRNKLLGCKTENVVHI
jgi:hypothetical protein